MLSSGIPYILLVEMWGKPMAKRRGKHPDKDLNPARVRAICEPGRYPDGNGLYLVVDQSGAKRWMLRTMVNGRRRDMGLGSVSLVPLAEARDLAAQYRRVARDGGDPIADRRKAKMVVPSFADAARQVHGEYRDSWKNQKHAAQWINTLEQYVFPALGDRAVNTIESPDVIKALSPIWLTKPETARRVRQRIGTVLDWAKASGFRSGDNPVEGASKGLPKQPDRKSHFKALPYNDVPEFVQRLQGPNETSLGALAFEFMILTATRTGEVLGARWAEIDLEAQTWTVPADRMKAGKEHRVPLADRCIDILRSARELAGGSALVFPGSNPAKPLSNMVFLMTLRRLKVEATAHGFRSAFRDWASEKTNFPRDVCEMALAHTISNKVEAAYRRGDLFEKRRALMDVWSSYVSSNTASVVPLRA